MPPKTARIAVIGGGAPGETAAGWHGDSVMVQLGGRSLAGPHCTVTSSTLSTRRGTVAVSTGLVTAASAVGGRSLVTTRLPATIASLAVKLEAGAGAGGEDALLELGLSHARTAGAPLRITEQAATTSIYSLIRDPDAPAVEVTVASGRDVELCGVLGSPLAAAELAAQLRERGFQGVLGPLTGAAPGTAHVTWRGAVA
jgi:hypothetical protein